MSCEDADTELRQLTFRILGVPRKGFHDEESFLRAARVSGSGGTSGSDGPSSVSVFPVRSAADPYPRQRCTPPGAQPPPGLRLFLFHRSGPPLQLTEQRGREKKLSHEDALGEAHPEGRRPPSHFMDCKPSCVNTDCPGDHKSSGTG